MDTQRVTANLFWQVVMDHKHLHTLEYPKILELLAAHTSFSAGRELALKLPVYTSVAEVRQHQEETSEARVLLSTRSDVTLGGARDVRPQLLQAERAAVLLPMELLDIRQTLIQGRTLRRILIRMSDQCPHLAAIAEGIEECEGVIAEIGRCLNDRGEVVDGASLALAQIRSEVEVAHRRLLDRLNRIVTSPETAPYLQEPFVTQRGGRYVIPLNADFKGRIPGIVHDQSASGATLFIEPLFTVELNNRWRELQLEEEREVRRILTWLSRLVGEEAPLIRRTVETLAELDLAFAKARYAEEIRGITPKLIEFPGPLAQARAGKPPRPTTKTQSPVTQHSGSCIRLLRARHPLLDPDRVVPIDLALDDETFILVITGPNTGGKTVALKTVGLLALMAQAGLHIPAAEGSALSVFNGIYADIGDEQSIEQSLSTFSSHLTNIISVLRKASTHSLVLLDELGAGTDPVEGSALARAILAYLHRRRITTLVATHFSELKIYAHNTPGVRNASVEFDLETLSPTYELTIGLPGRSNAFAIARRLGLQWPIIEEAQRMVSPDAMEAEALLAEIRTAREETLAARREAEAAREEVRHLEEELRQRLADIEEERRAILAAAREQGRAELEELRQELGRLRHDWQARTAAAETVEEVRKRLEELEERMAPPPPPIRRLPVPLESLAQGDMVWVERFDEIGQVVGVEGDEVEVQIGRMRARVGPEEIELRRRATDGIGEEIAPPEVKTPEVASPGVELDLRGQTVEEILPILDKYLDNAYLAGLPWVRIIHGKGTGALRHAVRQELAKHPLVTSQRPGDDGEGGEGVTVAELVNR
jgi:DNA mismatch repair protein MutS2